MFYNQIRPLTQHLSDKAQEKYKSSQIKREVHRMVQDEIAKIATRTNNSPYIEDHVAYLDQRLDDANEGSWRNPPKEIQDTSASFDTDVLKKTQCHIKKARHIAWPFMY